ncbi:YIP1 family protein [Alteromonas sp. ASW11-130]|uniref:YIP1 family protein n=1 Tax=Alteromonas sp. ASW11-130 TaxID=3015775 RepID=UPI002241A80C|nr:YIP1 family protein [Alteromonas sp. ASW11-130]MCW8091414.1 YIP1 family protein [Alteromonas sp. ASW11-130]
MEYEHSSFNPWRSIWFTPRRTIQYIIDTNPEKYVIVLAALSGFNQALGQSITEDGSESLGLILKLTLALFLGPLIGIIGLYIFAALTSFTGRWLGGASSSLNIRAAIAWSYVPNIASLFLWVPFLLMFGSELANPHSPHVATGMTPAFAIIILSLVSIVLGIWSFIIAIKCISQVQKFSIWRALANIILAGLVIAIPLLVIVMLFFGFNI